MSLSSPAVPYLAFSIPFSSSIVTSIPNSSLSTDSMFLTCSGLGTVFPLKVHQASFSFRVVLTPILSRKSLADSLWCQIAFIQCHSEVLPKNAAVVSQSPLSPPFQVHRIHYLVRPDSRKHLR